MAPMLGIMASQISGHLFAPSGAYESIATVDLSGGAAAYAEFTSIPATYKHLQIRYLAGSSGGPDSTVLRFNSDTASNYSRHALWANGSSVATLASAPDTWIFIDKLGPLITNVFGVAIIDILDYADTSKYKTVRALSGEDENGAGFVGLYSGNWRSTAAVSTIKVFPAGTNFRQYSHIALYGIKGA
jgi:hypothetical protein